MSAKRSGQSSGFVLTAEWSRMSGYVPARKSAIELLTKEGFYKRHPHYRTAVDQMQVARESPVISEWSHAAAPIARAMKQVLEKNVPAIDALTELARDIERQFPPPKDPPKNKLPPQPKDADAPFVDQSAENPE